MKTFLINLAVVIIAALQPIQVMLITTAILIVADLVLGIAAAIKRKKKIVSGGIRRTITKLFVYEISIILTFVVQHFLLQDSVPIVNIVTGFIGFTELLSCLENLNILSGHNLLKKILEKLNSESEKS